MSKHTRTYTVQDLNRALIKQGMLPPSAQIDRIDVHEDRCIVDILFDADDCVKK
ncbi:hypothetical protein LCGC14_0278150 [marine sediment metagenome]|uniref:Uncharacterized protein n=1 Tax=marine sediment metagenome TaxID=412755 RepID=A0A0F9UDN1_9ZZZZ